VARKGLRGSLFVPILQIRVGVAGKGVRGEEDRSKLTVESLEKADRQENDPVREALEKRKGMRSASGEEWDWAGTIERDD
jgi:hypothetical protein